MGGQRDQHVHLLRGERPDPAVGHEQHTEHPLAELQRHALDGDQALAADDPVDVLGVREALVVRVVGRVVRQRGLRDQPAQARAEREPAGLERLGADAVRRPDIGVAVLRVGEQQVRHVRAEQRAGAADDRLEHALQIPGGGQVAGRLVQGGEGGLPAALRRQPVADPQGVLDEPGRQVRGAGEQGGVVGLPGVLAEQPQQLGGGLGPGLGLALGSGGGSGLGSGGGGFGFGGVHAASVSAHRAPGAVVGTTTSRGPEWRPSPLRAARSGRHGRAGAVSPRRAAVPGPADARRCPRAPRGTAAPRRRTPRR